MVHFFFFDAVETIFGIFLLHDILGYVAGYVTIVKIKRITALQLRVKIMCS